jgi:hypothetical protein
MKTAFVLASVVASAAAFAPLQKLFPITKVAASKADLEAIAEKANPIVKFYDPVSY